jgi:catechol 2,3-dioxygenase-like lactoylglutathione lyase family enzyme
MAQHMRLEGLTLTVQSVDRAIDFYGGKLGIDATAKWPQKRRSFPMKSSAGRKTT